jgi:hypothetical protein
MPPRRELGFPARLSSTLRLRPEGSSPKSHAARRRARRIFRHGLVAVCHVFSTKAARCRTNLKAMQRAALGFRGRTRGSGRGGAEVIATRRAEAEAADAATSELNVPANLVLCSGCTSIHLRRHRRDAGLREGTL